MFRLILQAKMKTLYTSNNDHNIKSVHYYYFYYLFDAFILKMIGYASIHQLLHGNVGKILVLWNPDVFLSRDV